MASVLLVLTSHDQLGDTGKPTGWYVSEAAHPWKVLTDASCEVEFVSPKGGIAPMTGLDLDDPIQKEFMEAVGAEGPQTKTPDEIDASEFDIILYVGGHGTMWDFPSNVSLATLASKVYQNDGVVAAVCHGPAGLLNIKLDDGTYLVDGKSVAAFTNDEEDAVGLTDVVPFSLETALIERGANHVPASNFAEQVITDGRLVTGQNPASASAVGQAALRAFVASQA